MASAARARAPTGLSRSSLSLSSLLRCRSSLDRPLTPCEKRLAALASSDASRKNLSSASGKATVPMSRPSTIRSPVREISRRFWFTMARSSGMPECTGDQRSIRAFCRPRAGRSPPPAGPSSVTTMPVSTLVPLAEPLDFLRLQAPVAPAGDALIRDAADAPPVDAAQGDAEALDTLADFPVFSFNEGEHEAAGRAEAVALELVALPLHRDARLVALQRLP